MATSADAGTEVAGLAPTEDSTTATSTVTHVEANAAVGPTDEDNVVVPMNFDEFDVDRLVFPAPQPNKEGGFIFMPKYKDDNGAMTELVVQLPAMRVVFPPGPGLKKTLTPTSPLNLSLGTEHLPASYHAKAAQLDEKVYNYLCQYKDMVWPEDGLSEEQVRKKAHKVFASGINKKGESRGGYMVVKMDPKLQEGADGVVKPHPNPTELYYVDKNGDVIDSHPIEKNETIFTPAMREAKEYVTAKVIIKLTSGYTMAAWGGVNWRVCMGEIHKLAKPKWALSKTPKRPVSQVSNATDGADDKRGKTESDTSVGVVPPTQYADEDEDKLNDFPDMDDFE
jgi:hypothetical protein